jgi:hypothetical protein
LILLEKLCTEKEKRRHRFQPKIKNQVGTCGISERRFIQGDRPEAGAELTMTDRELAHLFLRVALDGGFGMEFAPLGSSSLNLNSLQTVWLGESALTSQAISKGCSGLPL